MMTQQQYFGQFSGDDCQTIEDFRKAVADAESDTGRTVGDFLDIFQRYVRNPTFRHMLNADDAREVLETLNFYGEVFKENRRLLDENPASETK